ncbi:MAG: hypothetical protein INH41_11500 [Myxococcaceae bacterium]|jgi:hypothetical protein|nr:hypothetical protein [Myxococcaceae bacterium]MCA3013007.1 hypothetical protein [Myxococcaceae bacterium]
MFTSPGPLSPEPLLVVSQQGDLMGADATTQLMLVRGEAVVGVKVVRSLLGRLVRQLVVVPERPLRDGPWVVAPRPGTPAFAAIGGQPLDTITIDHTVTARLPRFQRRPVNGGFGETAFDCGGESLLAFVDSELDRAGLVEVTLRGPDFELTGFTLGSTTPTRPISVGIFMCGGAFDLPRGQTFAVTLTPVAADGTRGAWYVLLASTPPLPPPRVYRLDELKDMFGLQGLSSPR